MKLKPIDVKKLQQSLVSYAEGSLKWDASCDEEAATAIVLGNIMDATAQEICHVWDLPESDYTALRRHFDNIIAVANGYPDNFK